MSKETAFAAEIAAMEWEAQRVGYPEAFPALPEIPGGRYATEEFHQLEMKYIWRKSWLYAGHTSQIPDTGSYLIFDKLGLSIIIVHWREGKVHALHNVCRHRGSALVKERFGKTHRFTCPYHSWSYGLDGQLAVVPQEHNFACLDKSERGLIPVRCEVWRGLIFINLDNDAKDLEHHIEPVAKKVAGFPLEKMKVRKTLAIEMNCNWKAAFDNFIEIYHVPTVHGKTAMNWLKPETFSVLPMKNGHTCITTERKIDNDLAELNTGKLLHGPLPKGSPVVPGADPFFHKYTVLTTTFPNLIPGGFNPGGFPLQTHWPLGGPGRSLLETSIIGWEGEEAQPEYWENLMSDMMTQVNEDIDILSNIQKSLNSGHYTGALVSYLERAIYWYHEEIDRRIGYDNIPRELAVQNVLSTPYRGS
jgi:nitrite reductase/ring-hydroxylating ferredoxin subunit